MRKLLLFLPFAFLAVSCSNDGGPGSTHKEGKGNRFYGGTLRFNETDKFQTLFPILITDAISSHVASQIYEGLVKFDPRTLRIVPSIAETWEIDPSGTLYTFHLRKDVKFQDDACFPEGKGRVVTADDFKYSFEMLCRNNASNANFLTSFKGRVVGATEFYNDGASQAGSLKGVKVVDASTLQITLEQPGISFLSILANPSASVIPREAMDKYGDKMHVGTGPFMVANIANDTSTLVLVRNPEYYGSDSLGNKLPFLDSIRISYIDNKKAELDLFQKGDLDFVWGLSSEAVKILVQEDISNFKQKPPRFLLDHSSEFVTQLYQFNTTRPPFDDVRVRRAFSYAIDRNHIVNEVLAREAYGPGINGISPPALPGYRASEIKGYEMVKESDDSTKAQKESERVLARKLLAEAGYGPGKKPFPNVKLVLNSGGSRNTLVAEEIQNQLREHLGVNLEIANVSFQQKLSDERFARSDMFRSAWVADYPSAESFLSLYYGSDVPDSISKPSYPNTSRYRNAEFDKLYDAARTAKTQDEANKLFFEAEQMMMNDAPAIILWYDENYRLTQYRVKNFFTNPMRYLDFSQVYIKEEPKKNNDGKDSAKDKTADANTEEKH